MIVPNRNLLNIVLVSTMLSFTIMVNAASSGSVARTKCKSVEQEVVDFEILEQRIRKTSAIGGLAKLRLSGDIKKMVAALKTYHAGDSPHTLEQHREQYDLLYMKVVTQVQDKDPELFNHLCNAWDPLWTTLQDGNNLKNVYQPHATGSRVTARIADLFMSIITTAIQPVSAEAASTEEANTEESLSHDEAIKRDLLFVVVAHGVICTAVTAFEQLSNHDYVATCESGDKYRAHVSDDGRVNVTPHQLP